MDGTYATHDAKFIAHEKDTKKRNSLRDRIMAEAPGRESRLVESAQVSIVLWWVQ